MKRENGYYWVSDEDNVFQWSRNSEPMIAEWLDYRWFITGYEDGYNDEDLTQLSDKLEYNENE